MTQKKFNTLFISLSLALILILTNCLFNWVNTPRQIKTTIEISRQEIDYQTLLSDFDNGDLEINDTITTFEGYKTIKLSDLENIDFASESSSSDTDIKIKYNFSYCNETNIVTLKAELKDELGEIQIDTITGAAFINEYGEIDAVMNIDGEGILLSEMQDSGIIANCGWFSRLIKKVVKVVVVATITATVVAATTAAIVATAGAAAPAVVAAGVGVVSSGVATGTVAGAAIATGIASAAITAGVGIGMAIDETITENQETTKSQTFTDTIPDTQKNNAIFPIIPETFAPKGLTMHLYPGTSNGRFIKWFDASGIMIFEWDEDLTNGAHYHIIVHDGIHYLPGTPVPEPYASMYF